MSDGFGLSPWGVVGPWGIGPESGVTFDLESIVATSERTVRVTFTSSAFVGSTFKVGSALNLNTWTITINGESLILLSVYVIPGSDNRQFELYTLNKFEGWPTEIEVAFPTLLSEALGPLTGATSGTCPGAKVRPVVPQLNKTQFVDLKNTQTGPSATLGVVETSASGDYAEDVGDALLRKMILRRLTTLPGEFFHIPPSEFGVGVDTKQPLTYNDLRQFKAELERQIFMEPDVADASASASLTPDGVLTVVVRARRTKSNTEIEVSQSFDQFQVVL